MTAHHHHYREKATGREFVLTDAELDRWFDNRDPSGWELLKIVPPTTLPEFVTDEMEI